MDWTAITVSLIVFFVLVIFASTLFGDDDV